MPANPNSAITRVLYRGRETEAHVLEADNFAAYHGEDGALVLDLTRYQGDTSKPVETFRFRLCPEDAAKLKWAQDDYARRNAQVSQ